MGPAQGDPETEALPVKTAALLRKAGFEVILPEDSAALCCGQPFESKGLPEPADAKRREVEQALLKASRNGQDPVVFDTTPCALRVKKGPEQTALKLYDITEFLHDVVLDRLTIHQQPETVAFIRSAAISILALQPSPRPFPEVG